MPNLYDPLTIRNVTLRNRIGMSPMCQYSYQDGFSNNWQMLHLGTRAAGGVGLIISEATAVEPNGRISPYDVGIWSDEHILPLQKVTEIIRQNGAVAGIQLAHAGRKACTQRPWDGGLPIKVNESTWWQSKSASSIAFSDLHQIPEEMSEVDIRTVLSSFQAATRRSWQAGFQWMEIHAAHGYLIHNFYSPLSNQRKDEYGGCFENRIRFLLQVVAAVRLEWPDELPLTVRISGTDWVEGGWTSVDSVRLAGILKLNGVDLIDCSSGGNTSLAQIPLGAGYQVPISEAIRKQAGIATAAVGLITSPMQADEIIRNERADIVLLGRELLRNPYWALNSADEVHKKGPIPDQYLRAF